MIETVPPPGARRRLVRRLVELGLMARVLAALAASWAASRRGDRWLFPDTDIYWRLGQALRLGEPYEVLQWGVPHFALRTPGYPLFLALCQLLFGDRAVPARLVQAALGALAVWIVYRLVRAVTGDADRSPHPEEGGLERLWTPAVIAAGLAAVEPYTVATSAMLLSEALFLPLMLLGLWGLAAAWDPSRRAWRWALPALGAGAAWGAAVLTKPSWALFPPMAAGAWLLCAGRGRRGRALAGGLLVGLGLVLVMLPWWVRNEAIFGRFVPTALWSGASLYDGWNPEATGASDMTFLGDPAIRALHEEAQDAELTARARAFARENPRRALELAAIKAARYWSPWPNLEAVRAPWVAVAGAAVVVPLYLLALVGLWDRRRDARSLVLLAAPVLYFAAIHLVFVSSIRYRIPGFVPAFGLVGIGWSRLTRSRDAAKFTSTVE